MSVINRVARSVPLRSPLRWSAAAACLVAAAAHVPVVEDHLDEAPYIGVLFIALSAVCVIAAALLVLRDSRPVWLAQVVTGGLAVGAFVWSRAFGLPQIGDDVGRWTTPLALVAVAAETLMVLLAVRALRPGPATDVRPSGPSRRPLVAAAAVLGVGLAWTGVATASTTGEGMARSGTAMSGSQYWSSVGGSQFRPTGVTRWYYISADVVAWNYAPTGRNAITGKAFDDTADTYVRTGPGRIGSTYDKCVYRGYTDASFATLAQRPASEQYLGLLGPVIRAEVGDRVTVVFRNTCPFPASVHVHGLLYTKADEGAPYADGTGGPDKKDDAVPTGGRYTYHWAVPDRAGPGPKDGSSVMWMYHSHTDEIADTYAGLMGPIEITARGHARRDGSPSDVDREVFELFSVMNENNSPFLERNEHAYEHPYQPTAPDDEGFEESNLMHSINGYVFGNQPMLTLRAGQHVRWYVMSMGTEVDLHTPHWHGNDVTVNGMRMDVINLLPASMVVADMVPDDPGTWLFHCHVNDHLTAGMLTRYQVTS